MKSDDVWTICVFRSIPAKPQVVPIHFVRCVCCTWCFYFLFSDDLDCTMELVKLNLVCKYVVLESDLHQGEEVVYWFLKEYFGQILNISQMFFLTWALKVVLPKSTGTTS